MTNNILDKIKAASNIESNLQEKFGLKLNPFPKSGIAHISDPDRVVGSLVPIYDDVTNNIVEYMTDALSKGGANREDKYISLVVRGEYGSGKTQLLMYMRYLFKLLDSDQFHPYVVYIDNPGLSIPELIGNVVSQIGVENFRRYLWDTYITFLKEKNVGDNETRLDELVSTINTKLSNDGNSLFKNFEEIDWSQAIASYKKLMDDIIARASKSQQKEITEIIKNSMNDCFLSTFQHATVAEYFYNIVSENVSMLKSWGALIEGTVKNMDKRAVYILNAIVKITKDYLNRTDFIILVDEFEEIATGRLKDSDLDNYLRNLRALIDKQKQWCSVFAMTGLAFEKIKQVSPPLASRIGDRVVDLKPFGFNAFRKVVVNYLNLARDAASDSIYPFTDESLHEMLNPKNNLLKGSPRFLLRYCYLLLQRAADELSKGDVIDIIFTKKYMSDVLK